MNNRHTMTFSQVDTCVDIAVNLKFEKGAVRITGDIKKIEFELTNTDYIEIQEFGRRKPVRIPTNQGGHFITLYLTDSTIRVCSSSIDDPIMKLLDRYYIQVEVNHYLVDEFSISDMQVLQLTLITQFPAFKTREDAAVFYMTKKLKGEI